MSDTRTVKFNGCKNLDYQDHYTGCAKKHFKGLYVYWERDDRWNHEGIRQNVQFCSKRGRLNNRCSCIEGGAECNDYENVMHEVEVEEDE